MKAYPTEMRKRILADCDAGMGTQAVALKCASHERVAPLASRFCGSKSDRNATVS